MFERFLAGLMLLFVAPGGTPFLKASGAQQKEDKPAAADLLHKAETQARPANVYRVDYVLHELENGRRTNTRNYTLMVSAAPASGVAERGRDWTGFHVGSRIPISTKESFTYYDLGVKINCRLKERQMFHTTDTQTELRPDNLLVETILEVNSVAAAEAPSASTPAPTASTPPAPVIRSLDLSSITQAVSGRPALVGSVDDVTTNRRYEIEVTATRVK